MLNDPASVPWKTIEESRELAWNGPGFDGITMGMEFWKPIIAAINGYCIAGGNEIALPVISGSPQNTLNSATKRYAGA
ncbi:MAG: hypothetical protein FJ005_02595 [Chloroflexi bacterium]|nr:hypothetical protein [Chloroflexota bacterium]